ncbi:FscB [Rhodobacteraceae bacterium WD3A24]|nr:FscB [Rhodobacteraceae bacterium WD3A24]
MTHVLHLGHQPADLAGVTSTNISTDAEGFDPDLDVNCLKFVGNEDTSQPFSFGFDAPAGDLWFQFRMRTPDDDRVGFEYNYDPIVSFHNGEELIGRLVGDDGSGDTIYVEAHGDSTVEGSSSYTLGTALTVWVDIRVSVGSDITIEFYADGVLQSSATAANTGGKGKPTHITFNNPSQTWYSINVTWYIAHLAVLDGVSTINRRFARQTPNTLGSYDQWSGDIASLGDGDILTRMTSDAAGQRQNVTLTGPTGPTGAPISGVHLKAVAQAGTSGPGSLAGSLRIGTTDYDEASVSLNSDVPGKAIFSWDQNPDTSAAWTDADLPDEIGLLSAT